MQSEVIAKIDLLLKMSESTSNISTLKVELKEIENSIREKKLELKELESSISDDKYFDASGEIVDKNIEISLTKKIKILQKSLLSLEEQLDDIKKEEEKNFKELKDLEDLIKEEENLIDILNIKIASENTVEKDEFKTLLKETESKIKADKKALEKNKKSYEKVQGKLEVLSFSKKELENKIDAENEKLIDVKANLLNKRGYQNLDLRKEDQDNIANLEKTIKKLEEEKNNILNDPVMIAEEAKNYLIEDDKTEALKKVKELKELILKQPYMDLKATSSQETLAVELANAEAKRDEFASMINSKNYESVDTTLIKDRIAYITDRKELLNKEIEKINEDIKQLDLKDLKDLNNRINYCENEIANLKEKMEEYEKTLKEEDLSIAKKASLKAAFDKKEEELNNVLDLLSAYKEDRKNLIIQSYELEKNNIKVLEDKIQKIDKEIKKLEKLNISSNRVKDIIAMENDKKILKELNDTVKLIKKRQSLKNTPSEIYDEIELLLGIDEDYDTTVETPIEENIQTIEINNIDNLEEPPKENNDLFKIEEISNNIESIEPIEDLNILNNEESIDNLDSLDIINDIPGKIEIESNNEFSLPTLDTIVSEIPIEEIKPVANEDLALEVTDINQNIDKLKVINVESLDNSNDNNLEESEFLIGDYKTEE